MKVNPFLPLLLVFCGSLAFFSCKDDDDLIVDPPVGKYLHGVFVVNEGPFGGTGSISWHDPATGENVADVFASANHGAVLGQFVQSLSFQGDRAYIVVNGANKVYVVDRETFEFLDTIGGLALPRHFLALNDDFAYVSQWGADGLSGSVARVDLHNNEVTNTIPTGHGPDKMLLTVGGLVYVPNSGGFGVDSTISVLDPALDQEVQRLTVAGTNPGTLAEGLAAGSPLVFVHCRGSFLDATPAGWVGAVTGDPGYPTPPYGDDLVAAPGGLALYYTAGGSIWKLSGLSAPVKAFDQAAYGLACHPTDGNLYCADAKDFSSAGEVLIYTPMGQQIGSFPAGIAPGEVVIVE